MPDLKQELPEILVLSAAQTEHTRQYNTDFVQELNDRLGGICCVVWHGYHEIGLRVGTNRLEAFLIDGGRLLNTFKAVYFKSYLRHYEEATTIAEALDASKTFFVGSELREYIAAYKLNQMARLGRAGLSIPDTLYLPMSRYLDNFDLIEAELGRPFIFKATGGKTGDDNYLVKDRASLEEITKRYTGELFIAQRFIPNESDMRVLIVGGKICLVIERKRANDDTHLNNTSKGASARLIEPDKLDPELRKIALTAATTMKRDVAGVDLMCELHSGTPYVLEVNASPQVATGAFKEEKLAVYTAYFKELAKQ